MYQKIGNFRLRGQKYKFFRSINQSKLTLSEPPQVLKITGSKFDTGCFLLSEIGQFLEDYSSL